jgi:hypothetical protein
MKIRVSVTALLLSLAIPTLLTEARLDFVPGAEPLAMAQDPVTEVARQRFGEGVKAFDGGRFEDARAAFLQAYALKRNPMILLNLGQAELKSNHPEDAGNHLQQFLHEATTASPDQKSAAEKGIAEAKKHTAFIVLMVDANGADVSIDGALVGKSPVLEPFFVKPGKHTVLATFNGKSATATVDAKSGSATAANLSLGVAGTAPAPVPAPVPVPGPVPGPTPTPTPVSPGPTQPAPTQWTPPPTDQPAPFMGPGPVPPTGAPDSASGEREPFFHWYTRKPLAWVGTGLAVGGLVVGIAFSAAAGGASATADKHTQQIKDFASTDPKAQFGAIKPCGSTTSAGSDLAGYEAACTALRKDLSAHSGDVAAATVGWVLFGAGVVGTAAYAMIDWFPKKQTATATTRPRVMAMPVVSPAGQGFAVVGSF